MRRLGKLSKPEVLEANEATWLSEYLADKTNGSKKYKYRHADIKQQLKNETGDKCVYCESKIGHNTPGDIEHKVPSSKNETLHFAWENLTIACTECNRRKNDYYSTEDGFLDPYIDDVEAMLVHRGPIVMWKTGEKRAEIAINILELCKRMPLISRKIEKITDVQNLIERYNAETNPVLKGLLKKALIETTDKSSEFSGMLLGMVEGAVAP